MLLTLVVWARSANKYEHVALSAHHLPVCACVGQSCLICGCDKCQTEVAQIFPLAALSNTKWHHQYWRHHFKSQGHGQLALISLFFFSHSLFHVCMLSRCLFSVVIIIQYPENGDARVVLFPVRIVGRKINSRKINELSLRVKYHFLNCWCQISGSFLLVGGHTIDTHIHSVNRVLSNFAWTHWSRGKGDMSGGCVLHDACIRSWMNRYPCMWWSIILSAQAVGNYREAAWTQR